MLGGDSEIPIDLAVNQRWITVKHCEFSQRKRLSERRLKTRIFAFGSALEPIQPVLVFYFCYLFGRNSSGFNPFDLTLNDGKNLINLCFRFVYGEHRNLPWATTRLQGSLNFKTERAFFYQSLIQTRALSVTENRFEQCDRIKVRGAAGGHLPCNRERWHLRMGIFDFGTVRGNLERLGHVDRWRRFVP